MRARSVPHRLPLLAGALLALAACSGTPDRNGTSADARNTDAGDGTAATLSDLQQSAVDLEQAIASMNAPARDGPADGARAVPPVPPGRPAADPDPTGDGADRTAPAETPTVSLTTEPAGSTPAPAPDRREMVTRLAADLAAAMGEDLDREDADLLREGVRLLALHLVAPAAAEPELRALRERMVPSQRAALEALAGLFAELGDGSSTDLDRDRIADALEVHLRALAAGRPLTITDAALCRRITGFARYEAFESGRFIAGRRQPVLVYVELDHFGQRRWDPSTDGRFAHPQGGTTDRWIGELGAELTLTHDADGVVALHIPEQVVREEATRRRRDFYLVHEFALPSNLTVGRYRLKVTVRDKVDGRAVAERLLPLEVVAR